MIQGTPRRALGQDGAWASLGPYTTAKPGFSRLGAHVARPMAYLGFGTPGLARMLPFGVPVLLRRVFTPTRSASGPGAKSFDQDVSILTRLWRKTRAREKDVALPRSLPGAWFAWTEH